MDALGVDVVIGASQKGLMVHPGLAFVAADERALAFARANPTPRFYWDWQRRQSPLSYRKFCGTPPLAHLAGLEAALGLIAPKGWPRCRRATRAWRARSRRRSRRGAKAARCASSRRCPRRARCRSRRSRWRRASTPRPLRTVARERFQVAVAGGLGPLSGRVFRIGHMGDVNEAMILGCLAGVEAALHVQGIACGSNGVDCRGGGARRRDALRLRRPSAPGRACALSACCRCGRASSGRAGATR